MKSLSHVRLLETPWTAAYQVPPSMRFSRQEYWSGVPLPIKHFGGLVKTDHKDFPGGPVVKNPPCNAGDAGSIPGHRAKIPHATEHLSPSTATTGPVRHN